jgi:hypothetical protein
MFLCASMLRWYQYQNGGTVWYGMVWSNHHRLFCTRRPIKNLVHENGVITSKRRGRNADLICDDKKRVMKDHHHRFLSPLDWRPSHKHNAPITSHTATCTPHTIDFTPFLYCRIHWWQGSTTLLFSLLYVHCDTHRHNTDTHKHHTRPVLYLLSTNPYTAYYPIV